MACPAFEAGAYTPSVAALVDCRVEELGHDGYLALAATGSPAVVAIGGLITILIGLIGYRLLLGDPLDMWDGVLTVVRIGLVLAFATQWPAYQAMVYNLVVNGPAELGETLAGPIGGKAASVPGRVQTAYDTLERLADPVGLQPATAPPAATPTASTSGNGQPAATAAPQSTLLPAALPLHEQRRLSSAAIALLVSSLAGMLAVRLSAALLLALGPLFIATLLLRGLSGWFEGWVRGLAGAFVGSIAVTFVLLVELSILEPQAIALIGALQARDVPSGAAGEILATTLLFGLVTFTLLFVAARVGAGFRLPALGARFANSAYSYSRTDREQARDRLLPLDRPTSAAAPPSRATQIVDTLRATELRETSRSRIIAGSVAQSGRSESAETHRPPLGQSQRRTLSRNSTSAARRDLTS